MQATAPSVLTAEDDPVTRADLRLVLEDAGFDVVADARDGVEVVELARAHRPDVILLDLGLPGIDGIEASQRILAERRVPIVALTGRSEALAHEALAAGASSYVRKPFQGAEVVDAVVGALTTHRARDTDELRTTSLRALEALVDLLGYPTEWAAEVERSAWESGHVWRAVDSRGDRTT
jgi:response regulator NasT